MVIIKVERKHVLQKGFEWRIIFIIYYLLLYYTAPSYSFWEAPLLKYHSRYMDTQERHHCNYIRVSIFSKSFVGTWKTFFEILVDKISHLLCIHRSGYIVIFIVEKSDRISDFIHNNAIIKCSFSLSHLDEHFITEVVMMTSVETFM